MLEEKGRTLIVAKQADALLIQKAKALGQLSLLPHSKEQSQLIVEDAAYSHQKEVLCRKQSLPLKALMRDREKS